MRLSLGKFEKLSVHDLDRSIADRCELEVPESARTAIRRSREILDSYTERRLPVYGVNTQFGDDAYRVVIDGDYDSYINSVIERQNSVMRALGCGAGSECNFNIERATLLLRIHTLAQGASGVRESLIDSLLRLYNGGIAPVIYRFGSVGASGDLIPLSGIARVLMGEGLARYDGELVTALEALAKVNLQPESLTMKEGLSIVNGTSFMTAMGALAVARLHRLLPLSIAVSAACVEAMLGMDSPYMAFVHSSKHHRGQIRVAALVEEWFAGSRLIRSLEELRLEWREMLQSRGRAEQENVQDYYSLRAIAHGFGPFADDLEAVTRWIENEMNSLNDNPIIDIESEYVFSSANFLGDYVAVGCDHLRADVAKAGTWLHALFGNLVNPRKNRGLPSCLVNDPDAVTGFKTLQILVAALAIQNRNRCLPISAVMLPTEGDNQDMVSLGTHSAMDLIETVENFESIVSVMMMAAAQALEIRGVEKAGRASRQLFEFTRRYTAFVERDRPLHDDIERLRAHLPQCQLVAPWLTA